MEENKKTNSEVVEAKENPAAENGKLQTDEQLEDVAGGKIYTPAPSKQPKKLA